MDFLKVNNKIELLTQEDDRIEGLIGDKTEDSVFFSISADDKNFKLLRVGEKVKCLVYDRRRVIGFYADVSNRIMNQVPTYELSNFRDFSVIQRRENVRIPSTVPLHYSLNKYLLNIHEVTMEKEPREIKEDIMRYLAKGMMRDLSAGGLKFTCLENIQKGKSLLLIFDIEDDIIIVRGNIVYKEINFQNNKSIYIYGIKFFDLSEEIKEKIINHIFIMMRKKTIKK